MRPEWAGRTRGVVGQSVYYYDVEQLVAVEDAAGRVTHDQAVGVTVQRK